MTAISGLRLSQQQARLWTCDETRHLHATMTIAIDHVIDTSVVVAALQRIAARHEMLRVNFHRVPGLKLPTQVIRDQAAITKVEADDELSSHLDPEQGATMVLSVSHHNSITRVKLCLPMLCADELSLRNLARELTGELVDVDIDAEEPVQYFDFSEWQWSLHEDEEMELDDAAAAEAGRAFWQKHLDKSGAELSLTGERPGNGFHPAFIETSVTCQTPVPESFMARWALLLSRLTGKSELAVQNSFSARIDETFDEAIGLFSTVLPVHMFLRDDTTFAQLSQAVGEQIDELDGYLEYVRWSGQRKRGMGFDWCEPLPTFTLGGLCTTIEDIQVHQEAFKMKLACRPESGRLVLRLYFDRSHYQQAVAEDLLATLVALVQMPEESGIFTVPDLPKSMRKRLLRTFNDTSKGVDFVAVHQLVDAAAAATPNAIAVEIHGGTSMNFADLNDRANQVAHQLLKTGVGCDDLVAISMDRGHAAVLGMLASLKVGAAFVPIDPSYPAARTAFILEEAGARFVFTDATTLSNIPKGSWSVLELNDQLAVDQPSEPPSITVECQQTAYVIYTSGSTGVPKGVAVSHGAVANYLNWCHGRYLNDASLGAPVHSSLGFDLTVTSLLAPLCAGRTVVMIPEEAGTEGLNHVLERDASFALMKLTPSHLRLLNEWLPISSRQNAAGTLVLGGEALVYEDCRPWLDDEPVPVIENEYGPTEATVGCSVFRVSADRVSADRVNADRVNAERLSGPVPIGRPIQNMQLYVTDDSLRPVPAGWLGELLIGGKGLARGYLHRPALTAERFIPNPFSEEAGSRLYRSGDQVRFSHGDDPVLLFRGRKDTQVKVRGYRIEPAEIAIVLKRHPAISDAVVDVRSAQPDNPHLVAWYTAHKAVNVEAIREFLLEKLPEYMVPAQYVLLERLPLTAHGKVDHERLPDPDKHRPDLGRAYVAPRNPTETTLCAILAAVLGIDRVGVEDSFFALGGDSILSVRVAAMAKDQGLTITVQDLFRYPTVAALASQIESGLVGASDEAPGTEPFGLISNEDRARLPKDVVDAYPLSGMQQGMLFHMEVRDDSAPIYHNVNGFEVEMDFDPDLFQRAANLVIEREPLLRTTFDLRGYSQPLQLVHRSASTKVHYEDLRHLDEPKQRNVIQAFMEAENYKVFDLSKAPLIRLHFHHLSDRHLHFTFCEPHSLSDGWSTQMTMDDIFRTFRALYRGEEPPPEEALSVTFRDFIKLEMDTIADPAATDYWASQLQDAAPTRLPRWPNRDVVDREGHKQRGQFEPGLIERLASFSREAEVSFKSVILAAHFKVLSILSGERDLLTAVGFNGRPEVPGGDRLRGLFLNSLPFRFTVPGGNWLDLAQAVYRAETDMMPYRRYPFSAMRKFLGEAGAFEVGFNYIHFYTMEETLRSGDVKVVGANDLSRTDFPFAFTVNRNPVNPDQASMIFEYETTHFPNDQVDAIRDYYLRVFNAMVSDPTSDHDRIDLQTERERQWLQHWNDTDVGPEDAVCRCLHTEIETVAKRQPHAVAVEVADARLTYVELDRAANRFAHLLMSRGVQAEDRVALLLERSLNLAVALLGIHKAGAAYVPIDPDYPAERMAYLLEDSAAHTVVTHAEFMASVPAAFKGRAVDVRSDCADLPATSPAQLVSPDQPAYVIYTSGSTGKPKGALVSHRAIGNTLRWRQRTFPLTASDGVLQTTSLSFDASVWELFGPLLAGARLVLSLPRGVDGRLQIRRLVRHHQVSAFQLPPSWLRVFLDEEDHEPMPSLRTIITGAEPIPKQLKDKFYDRLPGVEFHNLYGPTEAALDVTAWHCPQNDEAPFAAIGKPIDGAQVYLLNPALQPVPVGTPGHLFIGGAGLMRGYHRRPKLTAATLIPDPFSGDAGARLYASGDLARFRPDGNLEFIGRLDNQVKIRGFRIELGEIEAALMAHDHVKQAAVIVREDQPGVRRLVGYVVPHGDVEAADLVAQCRQDLHQRLPEYMVPGAIVVLASLPLNPNGKVDRKALPEPSAVLGDTDREFVAARNDTERLLADIWSEELGVERVSMTDNFFELGGDSIVSIRVIARANQSGLTLTSAMMFQHQTVEALAQVAEHGQSIVSEQGPVTGNVPLTPVQKWFFEHDFPSMHRWNQGVLFKSKEPLEPIFIKQVLDYIHFHHDALRARFVFRNGHWQQTILAPGDVDCLVEEDFSDLSDADLKEEIWQRGNYWQDSLNLADGPLMRVVLIHAGPDRPQRLLVLAHHLVVDAVSWRILLEDLQMGYQQISEGKSISFPKKTTSFKTWADRLQQVANTDLLTDEREMWLDDRRGDAEFHAFDSDRPATENRIDTVGIVRRTLSAEQTRDLQETLSSVYQARIDEALLAGLMLTLRDKAQVERVLIETESHGREELFDDVDLSRTVGWFTSIYPLLLDIEGRETPGDVLKAIKEQRRRIPLGGLGYGILRYLGQEEGVRKQLADQPVTQIAFNYLGQFDSTVKQESIFEVSTENYGFNVDPTSQRLHLFDLGGSIFGGELTLSWGFSKAFHDRADIEALVAQWVDSVLAVLSDAKEQQSVQYTPSDFDADLSEDELDDLMDQFEDFDD